MTALYKVAERNKNMIPEGWEMDVIWSFVINYVAKIYLEEITIVLPWEIILMIRGLVRIIWRLVIKTTSKTHLDRITMEDSWYPNWQDVGKSMPHWDGSIVGPR